MAYLEHGVWEVLEVLRRAHRGEARRAIARSTPAGREAYKGSPRSRRPEAGQGVGTFFRDQDDAHRGTLHDARHLARTIHEPTAATTNLR